MMASLQATIRGNEDLACEPARLANRANRLFFRSTAPEHFATLFLGHYNPESRELRYVNCGHPPPVVLRRDRAERLDSTCVVLGIFEQSECTERVTTMEPGDRIVLFSDGVSEATRRGEVHGEDDRWVVEFTRRLAQANTAGLAESLAMAAVSDDDVSVLDLRFA
jgi:sigma-B regulation protein RsbU (phosphoserine phosphatase)